MTQHEGAATPIPEKRSPHFPVERGQTIADYNGGIGDPFRSISFLETMLRRGTITREMAHAGDNFHAKFQVAHLEPLKAADFAQTRISGKRLSLLPSAIEDARTELWEALLALGGLMSPCGSIAWDCLGREITLEGWAMSQGWRRRPVHRQAAAGILIGTLGVLVAYYGLDSQENLV